VTTCKSKAHEHYRAALEGLYIQTWMASRDLAALIDDTPAGHADALEKGTALHLNEHKIVKVEERLAFGRQQLAEATVEVNRHFDRGCRNVKELVSIEATCAVCGDQCVVPGDEDPEDTLCVACAEEEQNS
jgi:hypothetical protein